MPHGAGATFGLAGAHRGRGERDPHSACGRHGSAPLAGPAGLPGPGGPASRRPGLPRDRLAAAVRSSARPPAAPGLPGLAGRRRRGPRRRSAASRTARAADVRRRPPEPAARRPAPAAGAGHPRRGLRAARPGGDPPAVLVGRSGCGSTRQAPARPAPRTTRTTSSAGSRPCPTRAGTRCSPRCASSPPSTVTADQLEPDDLRRLRDGGVAIGNHTWSHPCLDRCTSQEVQRQVCLAHESLADVLGEAPAAFAYPNGNHDPRAERLLRELGYRAGFLFDHRLATRSSARPVTGCASPGCASPPPPRSTASPPSSAASTPPCTTPGDGPDVPGPRCCARPRRPSGTPRRGGRLAASLPWSSYFSTPDWQLTWWEVLGRDRAGRVAVWPGDDGLDAVVGLARGPASPDGFRAAADPWCRWAAGPAPPTTWGGWCSRDGARTYAGGSRTRSGGAPCCCPPPTPTAAARTCWPVWNRSHHALPPGRAARTRCPPGPRAAQAGPLRRAAAGRGRRQLQLGPPGEVTPTTFDDLLRLHAPAPTTRGGPPASPPTVAASTSPSWSGAAPAAAPPRSSPVTETTWSACSTDSSGATPSPTTRPGGTRPTPDTASAPCWWPSRCARHTPTLCRVRLPARSRPYKYRFGAEDRDDITWLRGRGPLAYALRSRHGT